MWPFPKKKTPVVSATPSSTTSSGEDSQAAHRIVKEFFLKQTDKFVHTNNITTIKSIIMGSDSDLRSLRLGEHLNKLQYPEPLNGLLIDFERKLSALHEDINKKSEGKLIERWAALRIDLSKIRDQLRHIDG